MPCQERQGDKKGVVLWVPGFTWAATTWTVPLWDIPLSGATAPPVNFPARQANTFHFSWSFSSRNSSWGLTLATKSLNIERVSIYPTLLVLKTLAKSALHFFVLKSWGGTDFQSGSTQSNTCRAVRLSASRTIFIYSTVSHSFVKGTPFMPRSGICSTIKSFSQRKTFSFPKGIWMLKQLYFHNMHAFFSICIFLERSLVIVIQFRVLWLRK